MAAPLAIAVCGTGVGRGHVQALAARPDLFRVSHVVDLNPDRAAEVAAIADARPVTSLAEVLDDPAVDIVDICLPPSLHFTAVRDALAAGKHVICEKPLVATLAEVDALAEAASRAGRRIFPVFQYRYGYAWAALTALKRAGLTGKPYTLSMETHWQRGPDYYTVPWRGTWAGEIGGSVASHASHIHNLATLLMGDVVQVAAFLDTRIHRIETEDCGAIAMRTSEGALLSSSMTQGSFGSTSRFRACFEHLTATASTAPYAIGSGRWTFEATDPARQPEIDAALAATPDPGERFHGFFPDVHAALTGGATLYVPTMAEARHSIELMTAIYASAQEGRIVALPLAADDALMHGWRPHATPHATAAAARGAA